MNRSDAIPEDAFTVAEIELEQRRMAREWRAAMLKGVALFGVGALLGAANAGLLLVFQGLVRPRFVTAVAELAWLPGPPAVHWYVLVGIQLLGVVTLGPMAAFCWLRRHPPRNEEWTYRAVQRLTDRGGLFEEAGP